MNNKENDRQREFDRQVEENIKLLNQLKRAEKYYYHLKQIYDNKVYITRGIERMIATGCEVVSEEETGSYTTIGDVTKTK